MKKRKKQTGDAKVHVIRIRGKNQMNFSNRFNTKPGKMIEVPVNDETTQNLTPPSKSK